MIVSFEGTMQSGADPRRGDLLGSGEPRPSVRKKFLKRVGCSTIWCTPRHPEANSVDSNDQGHDIKSCAAVSAFMASIYWDDSVCVTRVRK